MLTSDGMERGSSAAGMQWPITVRTTDVHELHRVIREGANGSLFTIGYERRDGEGLIAALRDAGVEHLADIRQKPWSRKPGFSAKPLRALCESAGIEYGPWPELGSTQEQRDRLEATGDIAAFFVEFEHYARSELTEPLDRLAVVAKSKVIALLCYERAHEDCHRRVIAELLAERLGAGVVAFG